MKCHRLTQRGFLGTMSEITFNEFAKQTVLALKELEYDLNDCTLSVDEWLEFLVEEVKDEAEEEIEEADFLREVAIFADVDNLTYRNLEKLWEINE
jgi:hypothetical protein